MKLQREVPTRPLVPKRIIFLGKQCLWQGAYSFGVGPYIFYNHSISKTISYQIKNLLVLKVYRRLGAVGFLNH